ncbi:MAG: DUF1294 domain-containing protein [Lachnospiraceae bacterium]|nr:DUF1294 domain-containing protein [Lachnospiraceae bacterium]
MDILIQIFLYYFIIINIVALVMYGVDKDKAQKGKRRISEKTLLTLAAVGGAFGALIGMRTFNHKTRKTRFALFVPLMCMVWCFVLACIYRYQTGNWFFDKGGF